MHGDVAKSPGLLEANSSLSEAMGEKKSLREQLAEAERRAEYYKGIVDSLPRCGNRWSAYGGIFTCVREAGHVERGDPTHWESGSYAWGD